MANKRIDDSTHDLRPLCACGCGRRVAKYRASYIGNHRRAHMLRLNPRPLCACGCGQPVEHPLNQPWKWNRYLHNHHSRVENHPRWRGGEWATRQGYVYTWCPGHPRAKDGKHVKRATIVMEKKIGRLLKKDEQVHHINGDKQDDRPENLQVLTCAEHATLHARLKKASRYQTAPNEKGRTQI